MGILKLLIVVAVLVSVISLGGVVLLYYFADLQQNVTVQGTYAGPMNFINSMDKVIGITYTELGYIVVVLIIIMLIIAAIGYMGIKSFLG